MEREYCDAGFGEYQCFRPPNHGGAHASSRNITWADGETSEPNPRDAELTRLREAVKTLREALESLVHDRLCGCGFDVCPVCGARSALAKTVAV